MMDNPISNGNFFNGKLVINHITWRIRRPSEEKRKSSSTTLWRSFFIGAGASNSIKDTLKAIFYGQNDVGDAITASQKSLNAHLERLAQDIGSTHGGIPFYASQLSGFKTEVKTLCDNPLGRFKSIELQNRSKNTSVIHSFPEGWGW